MLKSHEVAGAGFAFPLMEQIVPPGDLPPSLSADPDRPGAGVKESEPSEQAQVPSAVAPVEPAAQPGPAAKPPEEVQRMLLIAREAEARAHALERRAQALLEEAEETGFMRLNEVEDQIEQMLAKAVAAVERIEGEAREKGYAAGREEGWMAGVAAGQAEADALLARAQTDAEALLSQARMDAESIRQEAVRRRNALLDAGKDELLDLALVIARQVLRTEIQLRPQSMMPMLEAALAKMKGEEEPHLRVSPEVLDVLAEHRGRLLAAVPGVRKLGVEKDHSLQPGDFVVQGHQGVVDGRIEEQVNVMGKSLREEK